jgi:hypothetical protein
MLTDLGKLTSAVEQTTDGKRKLPPVHLWNPPFCGDIDIRIACNGNWFHEGSLIRRAPLVCLLSSILKKENEEYFLVTPVEKMRIQVEDAPFLVIALQAQIKDGQSQIVFRTLTDDTVPLDVDHPLRVQTDPVSGEPRPYVQIRGGMEGLIHRPVFYDLVERAEECTLNNALHMVVRSYGEVFDLGCI